MATETSNSRNFFKAATIDEEYWTAYLESRPKYSPEFYNLIYDYHSSHGTPSWAQAHDIGTGPGNVAAVLADKFGHVIVSDNNDTHLAIAQHRIPGKKFTLLEASGEDVATKCPASSADLIAVAECIPLMDVDVAVRGFASMLRPGGTLAIWFYGRPIFAEEAFAPSCQPIYDKIANRGMLTIIKNSGPERMAGMRRAATTMLSRLDSVALPAEQWTHVKRYKWNVDAKFSFVDEGLCKDLDVNWTSRIGTEDEVTEQNDRSFWGEKWTVEDTRTFDRVLMPVVNESEDDLDEETENLYKELEQAMGGKNARRAITWPVVLLLAEKK